jgi:hypothetical protein
VRVVFLGEMLRSGELKKLGHHVRAYTSGRVRMAVFTLSYVGSGRHFSTHHIDYFSCACHCEKSDENFAVLSGARERY